MQISKSHWYDNYTKQMDKEKKLKTGGFFSHKTIDFQGWTPNLTNEQRASISKRVALVARHCKWWQLVEERLQQRLQSGGWRVRGIKQVEDLRTGWTKLTHWGNGNTAETKRLRMAGKNFICNVALYSINIMSFFSQFILPLCLYYSLNNLLL